MLHDILPTQERLFRMNMPNISSSNCTLCNKNIPGNLVHSLLLCPFNAEAGNFLLDVLHQHLPSLLPQQVVLLDLNVNEDLQLPLLYITAEVLSQIWLFRREKRPCHLASIRAALEAGINIMRKSRFKEAARKLNNLINST